MRKSRELEIHRLAHQPETFQNKVFVYVASMRRNPQGSWKHKGGCALVMMTVWGTKKEIKVRGVPLRELISCWIERPESMLKALQGQLRSRPPHWRMETSLYQLQRVGVPPSFFLSLPALWCSRWSSQPGDCVYPLPLGLSLLTSTRCLIPPWSCPETERQDVICYCVI